jgi:hypothetical protein
MPVALIEFDNTLANTVATISKINRYRSVKVSVNTMDSRCMSNLDFNAYILVMIHHLRQKGYFIDIYTRRKASDPDGLLVKEWLDKKQIYYDKVHVLGKNDKMLCAARGYTYLITTSISDAVELNKYSMLSSSTIVNTVINYKCKLPSYCDRLYL